LDQSAGFDLAGLTTLAYFSLGLNANGSLDESGAGWNGYESQALSTLITRAHARGTRVVLTVNDFDQRSLDALTSTPAAAITLSKALIGAIEAKNLDGVNLDLEGSGDADQAGLTRLVTTVSNTLHSVNAHWQVTMDTYASAAGDPNGFYNVSALAGALDAFFVMEYSPNVAATAQASSSLTSSLFSDLTTAEQYAAAVPANKVILGTPLFGEDWPTTGNTLSATASGSATTQSDSEIVGTGHPVYWDSVTDTAWTAYQVGSQWHETFFDDPTSLYQIAHLADQNGLGGVDVWALGMQGTNPAMVGALDGVLPAIQYATPEEPSTTTTTAAIAATASGAQVVTPSTTAPGAIPGAGASGAGSTSGSFRAI
jgi:spore germination protein YaaH